MIVQVEHMSWVSIFAIVPLCLSSIGILLTLGTILVLLKHKDTPIVRASGIHLPFPPPPPSTLGTILVLLKHKDTPIV